MVRPGRAGCRGHPSRGNATGCRIRSRGRRPPTLSFGRRRGPLVPDHRRPAWSSASSCRSWRRCGPRCCGSTRWASRASSSPQLVTKIVLFVVGFVLTAAAGGLEPGHRLPHPADLRPGDPAAAEPRPVPRGDRAAAADRHVRHPRHPRPARRHRRGRTVEDVPAVAQPRPVRQQGRRSSTSTCGFFVFTLPWIQFLLGFLTMVLVMATLAAAFTHYVYGGLQIQAAGRAHVTGRAHPSRDPRRGTGPRPGRDLLVRPLRAGDQGLDAADRHPLHRRPRGPAGQGHPRGRRPDDVGLFIASIWTRSWRLPVVGVGAAARHLDRRRRHLPGARPALQGQPVGEVPRERRTSTATSTPPARPTASTTSTSRATRRRPRPSPGQLRDDAETIPGIRLIDPIVVSPTFKQLQSVKSYYAFPDALDVDRYTIDGKVRDTVSRSASSTCNGIPANQRNWLNDHTVYTHGFGVVAAYGNQRTADGAPVFFERTSPSRASSASSSRGSTSASSRRLLHRRGAAGASPREFDYPDNSAAGQKNNTYDGNGGVALELAAAQAGLRAQVPRAQLPAVGRGQRLEPDPLPPRAARAGREGRSVADAWTATPTRRSSTAGSSGSSTATRPRPTTRTRG